MAEVVPNICCGRYPTRCGNGGKCLQCYGVAEVVPMSAAAVNDPTRCENGGKCLQCYGAAEVVPILLVVRTRVSTCWGVWLWLYLSCCKDADNITFQGDAMMVAT